MAEREASNQKMVDQFRRDVEVGKDQAHTTKVAQEMAVKERNRFGRTAATLEREVWNLGEDVRRLMKSGKEMSVPELKDLRKLLRRQPRPLNPPPITIAPNHHQCRRPLRRRHRDLRHPRRALSKVNRHRPQSPCRARSRHHPQSPLSARNRCRRRHRRRVPSHVVSVHKDPPVTAPVLRPAATAMTAPGIVPWNICCDIAGRHE